MPFRQVVRVCRVFSRKVALRLIGGIERLDRRAGRAVLLTFDDGPHPQVTHGVLDRLRMFGAQAVFYVVGNRIPRAPEVLNRILAEGHLIGNHTFEHWLNRPPGARDYFADLRKCQEMIFDQTGQIPALFCPPLGKISFAGVCAARRARLRTMMWSVDSEDWRLRDSESAVEAATRLQSRIGVGDIVLFYDDNPCVLTVLDHLLPHLADSGFDLSTGAARLDVHTAPGSG